MQEEELLLEKSVRLAIDARDEFWNAVNKNADNHYNRALVAASIGSYGAYLADGSEYSGLYGQNIGVTELKDFHRRRLQVLAGAIPDILAFETIPNKLETQAIVELLEDENIQIPSWICFSSVDGEHAPSGESFGECLKRQQKDPNKQEPSQSKVYKESRKRNPKKAYKTSSSISQANMEKMDALETQQSQGGEANIKDPYYEVIQKPEHSGRVRLFGIGVTKSSLKVKGSTTNKYIIPQEFLQSIEMQVVENIREANPRPHIVMPNGPSSQVEESNGGHHLVGAPSPNDREANLSGEVDINPKEQSIVQQNNNPEVQVESNGLVGSGV